MTRLGVLGAPGRAEVDGRGTLVTEGERWRLEWWVGADDRWRGAPEEVAVRQRRVDATPVVETAMRVPGGDAVQRAYGTYGSPGGLVVVEIENASASPLVATFVVREARAVALEGRVLLVDGRPALVLPFPPPRWSVVRGPLDVATAAHRDGAFEPAEDRTRVDAAVLFPLSHRARMRIAAILGGDEGAAALDLGALPAAEEAARGWRALLERQGAQVTLPDPALQARVDAARADVLLDPDPDGATVAALEDWGFDERAEWGWHGLSWRERRVAGRRPALTVEWPAGSPSLLRALRRVLVHERDHDVVDLLGALPPEWAGANLDARDFPMRHGRISYSLRWHGERPALLWEVADAGVGIEVRAPGLDPAWSTREAAGEALLAPFSRA